MAHTHRQTNKHTDGHGDSMTDPAQRAESVKTFLCKIVNVGQVWGRPICNSFKTVNEQQKQQFFSLLLSI